MKLGKAKYDLWWIVLLSVLLFFPFLGQVHLFDWDEINFAECAREMIETGNYLQVQKHFQPFYEKPPLFIWMQAAAMQVFGVGEYAARFPNALAGMASLIVLFLIGRELFDRRFGWVWVLSYLGSILPHLYFKSGIIDPWFNLFIFTGFYLFLKAFWKKRHFEAPAGTLSALFYLSMAGLTVGLGVLTKGPVALLLPGLAMIVYWILERFRWYVPLYYFVLFAALTLVLPGLWFGLEWLQRGPEFIQEFLRYQVRLLSTEDAGHGGFPGYHFVVLLLGCFPMSVFAIPLFWKKGPVNATQANMVRWMRILFWVVLITFSVVQSKIIHYSSLAYFPLSFLGALGIYQIIGQQRNYNGWLRFGVAFLAVFWSALTIAVAWAGRHLDRIKPMFAKDPFATANLEAEVHWSGWEVLPGLVLILFAAWHLWTVRKQLTPRAFLILLIGSVSYIQLFLLFFIPRIEGYSQRSMIEFCESLQGESCYIQTIGHKSYATHFYTRKKPGGNSKRFEIGWLVSGAIDRPTYLITKTHKAERLRDKGDIEDLYEKNGFAFFIRLPKE
ncbi:MAG: glycosyltransferase family 39 protein [Phaeodactylibacter sp.]|nr:glycosyltransferase family 39 protein [Phaeodactylibacter sp.]